MEPINQASEGKRMPEEIPPEIENQYAPFVPITLEELRERSEKKNEEPEEPEESEESEESETVSAGEIEANKNFYKIMKKKWEIKEEKELLRIKEEEIELDEEEDNIYDLKRQIKNLTRSRKDKISKVNDLYVKQLNLESVIVDGEDEENLLREKLCVEKKIENLETEIEEMKNFIHVLENRITDVKAKIMSGRAKLARERKDINELKALRAMQIKEEEEGKWLGEPRWLI